MLNLIPFTFSNEAISRCFDDPELSETFDRVEKMSERITQQINQFNWGNVDYDFQLEKSLIPVENYDDNVDPVQGMDQCLDEDDQKEALDTDQDMEDLMNWSKNG